MGRKNRTHSAGSHTQASSSVSHLAKLLFQILQCVHHLANIGNSEEEGIKTRAFLKKQKELDNFVRPAQEHPGSGFRDAFRKLTQKYLVSVLATLSVHYLARLELLGSEIRSLDISNSDLQIASEIALRWGRKNFWSKLTAESIKQFNTAVRSF